MDNLIKDRTVTSVGVSIGTGLALETLFDIKPYDENREAPPKVKPGDYEIHMYNIYTLYRNVISSIKDRDVEHLIASAKVKEQLVNDMYNIIELYKAVDVKLVFYLPDYKKLYKQYNRGKDSAVYPKYVEYTYMEHHLRGASLPGDITKISSSGRFPSTIKSILVLTSYTLDLVINTRDNMYLLESHTGKVKSKGDMGTKYHPIGKRDLSTLPVNKRILYELGDKTIVKPTPITNRRAAYEVIMTRGRGSDSPALIDKLMYGFNNKTPV